MGQAVRHGRWAVLAVAGALAVGGCSSSGSVKGSGSSAGSSGSGTPSSAASTTSSAATTSSTPSDSSASSSASAGGSTAPSGAKSWATEPAMSIDAAKKYTMTIHTTQGDIVIAMDAAKTPHTVNSMNFLAGQHFWDGSYCHRLSTSEGLQMLQCGDPTVGATPKDTDGTGGPGYTFADENLAGATYKAGTAAMANAGPGTNGSQFFLVFGDSQLQPDYTPFGTITAGKDVLAKVAAGGIASPGADGTGRPNIPVQITSVTVSPS
ncbi:MAG: peptidylprolyl isomerase [Catenulispora sp.]|nr:peptidylprolyl isomerase [Catenulispora sp.]